jgi:hypothetical protein
VRATRGPVWTRSRPPTTRRAEIAGIFFAALTILMVLSAPASEARTLHPNTTLKAPYKGTVTSPISSNTVQGCATAKAPLGKWTSSSGLIQLSTIDTAKSCKALGSVGSYSEGDSESGIAVGIPASVAKSGNYSFLTTWSTNLSAAAKIKVGGCPTMTVNRNPATNTSSTGYCTDGWQMVLDLSTQVEDVSNSSWVNTNATGYGEGEAVAGSYFLNETSCTNPGKPVCTTTSGAFNTSYTSVTNAPGFSAFTWHGVTTFSIWTNVSGMRAGDTYVFDTAGLVVCTSFVGFANLKGAWTAPVSSSVDASTTGHGLTLQSLTVM